MLRQANTNTVDRTNSSDLETVKLVPCIEIGESFSHIIAGPISSLEHYICCAESIRVMQKTISSSFFVGSARHT